MFDRIDELLTGVDFTVCALMVILPTADLPDARTRAENGRRLKSIHGKLRRLVTVALGDTLRLNLVRTIMRGMFLIQRQSHLHVVTSTIDDGVRHVLETSTGRTPSRAQILSALQSMARELGCELER